MKHFFLFFLKFLGYLALFFCLQACVERRIDIASTPSDAEVYLDGVYVGNTPISIPFDFYGTREVHLRKRHPRTDGQSAKESYLVYHTFLEINPPIYELFPLDFFTENLIPYPWKDIHPYTFEMQQDRQMTELERQELIQRTEALRHKMQNLPETKKSS
jgi:hypothetical protein